MKKINFYMRTALPVLILWLLVSGIRQVQATEVVGKTIKSNRISGTVTTINSTLQNDLKKAPIRMLVDTGASVGSVRTSITYMVPNNMHPKTPEENTWDIIQPYFESYSKNIEIITIDGETGKISKNYRNGENWAALCSAVTKEGKLYVVSKISKTNQQPAINIYDPKTNKWTFRAIPTPRTMNGSEYAKITIAPDGAVFVASDNMDGTDNDYKLRYLQIDSKSNKIVYDSGPMGDAKGGVWQLAADNDYVYMLCGKVPWRILQYHRRKHTFKVLAKAKSDLSVAQTAFGVVARIGHKYYFLYKGKKILADNPKDWRETTPPWPIPEKLTKRQIWYTFVLKQNIVKMHLPHKPKINSQNVKEADGKSELWIKQPSDKEFKKFEYSVKTYPSKLARLTKTDDGKIVAGTEGYGPYLIYDTKTGKTKHLPGRIGLSLYTMLTYNKKIYMTGYPMGALYEYDYNKPWTQGIHDWKPGAKKRKYTDQDLNPRFCCKLSDTGSGAHKMLSSAVGADGNLYFGGHWKRNGLGGGLGWYNPKTRKSGGIWKIFSNYSISDLTPVMNGRYIAIATIPVTDIQLKKTKPHTGRLFLFDTATKKIVAFNDPMPEFKFCNPGQIIGTDGPFIIGITKEPGRKKKGAYIYRVNMLTGKMDYKIKIENINPTGTYLGKTLIPIPGGKVLFWLGDVVVHLDPVSGNIKIISKYGTKKSKWRHGYIGNAVLVGKDLYIAHFKSILKLPNVLNPPTKN